MHLTLSYCVVLCNRMIGLTVFAMECKGAGFLLVSVQSKQETGNGVITKCFEGEQELLLLHSALKWDRTDNKRYWVRERQPERANKSCIVFIIPGAETLALQMCNV